MRLIEISSLKLFCCKLFSHKMFCYKNFCHKNVARKAKKFPTRGFPGRERKKRGRGATGGHAAHLLIVRRGGRHGHPPRRRPLWPQPRPPAPTCTAAQTGARACLRAQTSPRSRAGGRLSAPADRSATFFKFFYFFFTF